MENTFQNTIAYLQAQLGFVSEALKIEFQQTISFLESKGTIIVNRALKKLKYATQVITPTFETQKNTFFVAGKNGITKMWMSDEFKAKILKFLPATIVATEKRLDSFDLTEDMYDSVIMPELGNPPVRKMNDVVAGVAGMVAKQPNGEAGDLLSNGYSNIFYGQSEEDGRVLVLSVRGDSADLEWDWVCYELGEAGKWLAGSRVFSPVMEVSETV